MRPEEYANIFALEETHWWYVSLHELVEDCVREMSGGKPLDIFDAGCGTGKLMQRLGKYGRVSGVDASSDALRFCGKRGVSAKLANLNDWQAAPEAFHVITCIDVLYHDRITDETAILRKFHSALKPGGRLIVQLPAFPVLLRRHDAFVQGRRRYRRKNLAVMFAETGFESRLLTYRLPLGFFAALAKKTLEGGVSGPGAASDLAPIPNALNRVLLWVGRADNSLVRSRFPMPFGSSIFSVAEKAG